MKIKIARALTALSVLSLGLLVLPVLAQQQPRNTFTVVRATPWGSYNLNPFLPGDQRLLPTVSAIYESLFFVNGLDGKVTNVLGTNSTWSADNKTLTVTTRPNVKWNDGRDFSAADVAFTFNYLKQFPALDTSGIWKNGLTAVTAPNANTVRFSFGAPNTPIFFYLANQVIVPRHVWSGVRDPLTFTNQKPVARYCPRARVTTGLVYRVRFDAAVFPAGALSSGENDE